MAPQEPPLFELNNNSTPEEQLTSVLIEEQRLQKCWLKTSDIAEKKKYQTQLKNIIQTKQTLKSKIGATPSEQQTHDNLTPEERLALVFTEEQRLQEFDLGTASNAEKLKYQLQLKSLIQTKQALNAELDAATSQQADNKRTPEEHLALVLTKEQRLQRVNLERASNAEKLEYLAQLKRIIQTKEALQAEIEAASSQQRTKDKLTPEQHLALVLAEEQRLQEFNLETASNAEKIKFLAQNKSIIQTKQALQAEIDAASSPQEQQRLEEQRLQEEQQRLDEQRRLEQQKREEQQRLEEQRLQEQQKQEEQQRLDEQRLQEQQRQEEQRQQEQQQTHDSVNVEDYVPVSISSDKPQQPDSKVTYELGSTTPKDKTGKNKSLVLAIILFLVTSISLFIIQNSPDPQSSISEPEPAIDQKPEPQLELAQPQEKRTVPPQVQISSLEKEISKLIARLNKKEADFKKNLDVASNEAQKLIGEVGHGAANIKLAEQQAIYDLSQRAITHDNIHTKLQQQKSQADLLVEQKQYQAAIPELKEIKQGYQKLLANLDKAKPMYFANNEALSKQDEWLAFKRRHELGTLGIESNANTLLGQADTKRDTGQLVVALSNYQKATKAYHSLLTGPEAQEAIAAKNRQQIIAEIKNEMIKIPLGDFRMGDLNGGGDINEQPVHKVIISSFALKKTEVTFEQYDIFADVTDRTRPDDDGWGRGDRPVINVNWHDAVAYAEWLSKETGDKFRLPTEAEWEYAARAGHETKYSWGDTPSALHANGSEEYGWPSDGYNKQTAPVASYSANDFGIHDMLGNVQEWTQDCWNFNYQGASLSGKASTNGDCEKRILRGGSWADIPSMLRSSKRYWSTANIKSSISGFRLVQELKYSEKITSESSQNNSAVSE